MLERRLNDRGKLQDVMQYSQPATDNDRLLGMVLWYAIVVFNVPLDTL